RRILSFRLCLPCVGVPRALPSFPTRRSSDLALSALPGRQALALQQVAGAVTGGPRALDPPGKGRPIQPAQGVGAAVVEQLHLRLVEQLARLGAGKSHLHSPWFG